MTLRKTALALACALAGPAIAHADAGAALFERARLAALDDACALLPGPARAALDAGRLQARGALESAGVARERLDALEYAAADAAATIACDSVEALGAAQFLIDAHRAWAGMRSMLFAGQAREWLAVRPSGSDAPTWIIRQDVETATGAAAAFGVASLRNEAGLAVAVAGARPRAARLLLRDTELAPEPTGADIARMALGPQAEGLALRAAPAPFARAYWAATRAVGEDAAPLVDLEGDAEAAAFWFPQAALEALSTLHPSEAVAVEFDLAAPGGGHVTERVYVEVGDFAAALAFITAAGVS